VLTDVMAVWPAGEAKVWCERLAERLAALRPEVYGGWTGQQVTAALKPHGITTRQVWGTTADGQGANRRGVTRADLIDAAVDARH
jgi:DNA segregation ATPase FtsK/SpoIIIE, S-DNA-T family